jgi:hypothetical protein
MGEGAEVRPVLGDWEPLEGVVSNRKSLQHHLWRRGSCC